MTKEVQVYEIKNWEQFQHYKDRKPPWIKLATDTFQDYDIQCLQDASKLLLMCIWTLAARESECNHGRIRGDLDWIKRICGLGDFITPAHLQELENAGFIVAINTLAPCKHDASPRALARGREEAEESRGRGEAEVEQEDAPKPEPQTVIEDGVREAWNRIAEKRPGWAKCTKRPAGELGKLLSARCRDPDWLASYPAALEKYARFAWVKKGRLLTFVRPDTVRKILDEEWTADDWNAKQDIAQRHEEYGGAF